MLACSMLRHDRSKLCEHVCMLTLAELGLKEPLSQLVLPFS